MKTTRILELDWAQPYIEDGVMKLRNHYIFRDHFEYEAQELVDMER